MESSPQVDSGKGTVLLVDDEQLVLDIGCQMVKRLGFDAIGAASGREAIKIFQENRETIDIVILDMMMPDLGGRETVNALREIKPDANIVLSSGYGPDMQSSEILERCNAFIQKPFNLNELSRTISSILGQR
jgi:two-component system cell cycle sensor histidine kinase/response regulator CckA